MTRYLCNVEMGEGIYSTVFVDAYNPQDAATTAAINDPEWTGHDGDEVIVKVTGPDGVQRIRVRARRTEWTETEVIS